MTKHILYTTLSWFGGVVSGLGLALMLQSISLQKTESPPPHSWGMPKGSFGPQQHTKPPCHMGDYYLYWEKSASNPWVCEDGILLDLNGSP